MLVEAGALIRRQQKGQVIFHEQNPAQYYFQIISGSVAIVNEKQDGSEFIQGIFTEGQTFGTSALLLGEPYPATAVAMDEVLLIRLGRCEFISMLRKNPDTLLNLTISLSRKLYQKAFIGKGLASPGPEERVSTLLQVLKKESGCASAEKFRLRLSRQQVADMVGLRVETVIRAIKKLQQKGLVTIEHGKVSY